MLEYQSMLDQQNAEIARRKAEDKERKRKEDEALEKKLNEQRERMRMEYEEEQRRQRDREELMEKKRQDVIQAIEKTSHQMRESKKIACKGDTISLMSVDAVISATSSKVCDEQIKRTQSMYEVSSGDKEVQERKDKTFADVCIQTDYSLLLSWLFNMNERKDWESFLHQRDPVTTSSCPPEDDRKRSETRVAVSPKATQTECPDDVSSSSQTLSSLSPQPITYPIEKAKACGTKGSVSSKKPDYIEKAGAGGHQPQRPVVGQIRGRCKWNLSGSKPITKKGIGNSEEKDVQDARRRHAGIPYGNSSLISHEASSSSPGDSEKIIIPSEEG